MRRVWWIAVLVALVVGVALAAAVLPGQIARALVADVEDEAVRTAGSRYVISTHLNGYCSFRDDGLLAAVGLPAYDASYTVTFRSKECSSLLLVRETGRVFGPAVEPRAGGLHDWPLLRSLDQWDAQRRVAFLRYLAAQRDPEPQFVSRFDLGWPGGWWIGNARLLDIGQWRGFSNRNLAWAGFWRPRGEPPDDELVGQLLGYDTSTQRWVLLAQQVPEETGPIAESR